MNSDTITDGLQTERVSLAPQCLQSRRFWCVKTPSRSCPFSDQSVYEWPVSRLDGKEDKHEIRTFAHSHIRTGSSDYLDIPARTVRPIIYHLYIATVKMGGMLFEMMEVHFKAKTTQVQPPKDDILKKHNFTRPSAQQYNEETKLLKFQIYDSFDNAGKVKNELYNLLEKENILEEWDVKGMYLMTNNGEVFDALEDERLLKVFEMPTLEEFLDKLMPSTAGASNT